MASVIYCKRGDNLFLFNGELSDDTLEMIKKVLQVRMVRYFAFLACIC
jgi:hypothetical protein